jgi:transmembrane 9 superfamily protein 2/4
MFILLADFVLKALNWTCRVLDNLPVAVLRQRRDGIQSTTYEHGFRVGFKGNYQGVWPANSAFTSIIEFQVSF